MNTHIHGFDIIFLFMIFEFLAGWILTPRSWDVAQCSLAGSCKQIKGTCCLNFFKDEGIRVHKNVEDHITWYTVTHSREPEFCLPRYLNSVK
jgi:hypothetical protein